VPIVCLDARHASAALSMMPNKTDRHDAAGLAQIVRTGWYKEVRIKSHEAYVVRALLAARHTLVGIRGRIENEIRGLLKTFGIMFGKKVGGFARRADEIVAEELSVSPELRIVIEALMAARRAIVERIRILDRRVYALAKASRTARLFMSAIAPHCGRLPHTLAARCFTHAPLRNVIASRTLPQSIQSADCTIASISIRACSRRWTAPSASSPGQPC
jgi:transposase